MAPRVACDISSLGAEQGVNSSCVYTIVDDSSRSSASRLLLKLSCESPSPPRRSSKKADRIMAEKCVGTTKMRPLRRATTPETPTKASSKLAGRLPIRMLVCESEPETRTRKDLRLSMASSQASFYEGDDEIQEIFEKMDDEEVEELLDPLSRDRGATSGSSGSSLSSTTSASTMPTPLDSSKTGNSDRRRKRTDSPEGDQPCRRAKPSLRQPDRVVSKESNQKKSCLQPCTGPITVLAAHQRHAKQDRPIPRNMDPGHSVPMTCTSKIAVSTAGVVLSKESPVKGTTAQIDVSNAARASAVVDASKDEILTKTPATSPIKESSMRCDTMIFAKQVKTKISHERTSAGQVAPVIVAHDERKQHLLDYNGITKGVQFEIARGISRGWWSWDDVTDGAVEQLRGTTFEKAGKVAEIIGKGPKERLSQAAIATRQAIYAELDREQDAFLENEGRGLGLMGPWKGKENWHGGCVQLTCKLEFNKDSGKGQPPFFIRLNSFSSTKSNRVARRVTSLSILQLKFEKEALYDEKKYRVVVDQLSRDLVICGRRYAPFCTKEGKVFFVETKRDFQRQPWRSMGDHLRMSYKRFLNAINPLDSNKDQSMNKWLARWQLVLSTSRPVVEFKAEDIFLDIDDIYGGNGDSRQPESIMTDGCGWINLTALRLIASITNSICPVVVQGRIAGAKGLWLLHPSPLHRTDSEPPKIWIRKSQMKINLPPQEKWDRSLRIFDLVRLPRLTVPSGLNMQTIMNISYNGIKDEAFVSLMHAGLNKEIEALTKWDGDNACITLAKAVEEAGGVMASRRSRAAGGDARLYSYVRDENDDGDEDLIANGGLVERDSISGCPTSLYESARDMLLAGFTPLQNAVLREKLKYILNQTIKSYLEKFHIPVLSSAEAFIAPDPHGVLEEGEIYFRCSTPVSDPTTFIDPHTFLGPVLVSRNPTRVASDVRKVTAVSHDQLLSYTDVIIFSTKGERSLASYLGGGDYDGDTVTIIADPSLVDGFSNSVHIPEPAAVREAFEQQVEKVSAFLDKVKHLAPDEKYGEVSKRVLHGLSDGKVGVYSIMHDNAIYELGYNDETTIRLAYMFTTCLDSVKSGLRIKSEIYKDDSQKWNVDRADCMQKADESARNQNRSGVGRRLRRPRELGPFVLETLRKCAKELGDNALGEFEKLCDQAEKLNPSSKRDADLARPYDEWKEYAFRQRDKYNITGPLDDLEKIEEFVKSLCEEYISVVGPHLGSKSPRKNGGSESASKSKSTSQINFEFARRFEEGLSDCSLDMPPRQVKEMKASYAYVYGVSKQKLGRGFCFAVAEDMLCAFKVEQKGGGSTCRECRDFTLVSNNLVKVVCMD